MARDFCANFHGPADQRAESGRKRQADPLSGIVHYPAEKFQENCAAPYEIAIIPNCDHFYVGAEERVGRRVSEWLSQTLTLTSSSEGET
ncbi:MAG TPA: hypothetical protein VE131_04980 [Terriglobales bacterium]|nr:hypothetical protein [Terriglobales bacterium]